MAIVQVLRLAPIVATQRSSDWILLRNSGGIIKYVDILYFNNFFKDVLSISYSDCWQVLDSRLRRYSGWPTWSVLSLLALYCVWVIGFSSAHFLPLLDFSIHPSIGILEVLFKDIGCPLGVL